MKTLTSRPLASIVPNIRSNFVFNLEVQRANSYIVNGSRILVHNESPTGEDQFAEGRRQLEALEVLELVQEQKIGGRGESEIFIARRQGTDIAAKMLLPEYVTEAQRVTGERMPRDLTELAALQVARDQARDLSRYGGPQLIGTGIYRVRDPRTGELRPVVGMELMDLLNGVPLADYAARWLEGRPPFPMTRQILRSLLEFFDSLERDEMIVDDLAIRNLMVFPDRIRPLDMGLVPLGTATSDLVREYETMKEEITNSVAMMVTSP